MSLFMLDASRAKLDLTSPLCKCKLLVLCMPVELGWLKYELSTCHCAVMRLKTRVLKWTKFCISCLFNHWNEYQMLMSEGLERKFVWVSLFLIYDVYVVTQYLAQYNGLERKLSKGLEMSQKWTLLVITLEPLGVGGWNFVGWCVHECGHLLAKFQASYCQYPWSYCCFYVFDKLLPNLLISGLCGYDRPLCAIWAWKF